MPHNKRALIISRVRFIPQQNTAATVTATQQRMEWNLKL